ncbi:hypothetical protein ELS24_28775 [Achromobacter spanius]|uniref:hypothetical protein n=1 Tax=Achromobacter spanius TaxID=217203 RepID=UPI000F8FB78B|nr:hypothetical protein [Achromobacter spanius]AZS82072.1 hypothetical protein ELS24_28775 [Achromobacter spanius]
MGFARWVVVFLASIWRAAPILRVMNFLALLDGFRAVGGGVFAIDLARCTHPTGDEFLGAA